MATAEKNNQEKAMNGKPEESASAKKASLGIRLLPSDDSDRPVVSNYCVVNAAPGMAFIDFGFLEPGMLSALQKVGKKGGKLPERLDGKLAVRVALGYDAMAALHQQLGRALAGLEK